MELTSVDVVYSPCVENSGFFRRIEELLFGRIKAYSGPIRIDDNRKRYLFREEDRAAIRVFSEAASDLDFKIVFRDGNIVIGNLDHLDEI